MNNDHGTLRIIVVESDFGAAANVGGPVQVTRSTFDVPCSGALSDCLKRYADDKWVRVWIEGVEFQPAETPNAE